MILIFGESKYLYNQNAYGKAFKGIVDFINVKQDVSDIVDIDKFCCNVSKENFSGGNKAFAAAFATKNISTENLISNIKNNNDFKELKKFNEIICVAVNI
jgi:hypothetical protein